MTGGVELIDGVEHPDPEHRLDLACLAGRQERVEALERLDIPGSTKLSNAGLRAMRWERQATSSTRWMMWSWYCLSSSTK